MQRLLRFALLAVALFTGAVRAEAPPHVLACVWMDENGEGRTAEGRLYRLTDAEGKPYRLNGKVALTILDTKP